MPKKSQLITGGALAVAVVVSALLITSYKPAAPSATGNGTSGSATSTSSPGTSTLSTGSAMATGAPSSTSASPTVIAPATLKPFKKLPDPGIAARKVTSPLPKGEKLPPLTEAPADSISALKLGLVPDGSRYFITMRPYGIGPDMVLGSRVAIRVDASTPMGSSPALKGIVNANLLVLVDTSHGGTVALGGTYTAVLTFRSDGTKLLPILSGVKAK